MTAKSAIITLILRKFLRFINFGILVRIVFGKISQLMSKIAAKKQENCGTNKSTLQRKWYVRIRNQLIYWNNTFFYRYFSKSLF